MWHPDRLLPKSEGVAVKLEGCLFEGTGFEGPSWPHDGYEVGVSSLQVPLGFKFGPEVTVCVTVGRILSILLLSGPGLFWGHRLG